MQLKSLEKVKILVKLDRRSREIKENKTRSNLLGIWVKSKLDKVKEVWHNLHVACLTVDWPLHTQIDLKTLKKGSGSNF